MLHSCPLASKIARMCFNFMTSVIREDNCFLPCLTMCHICCPLVSEMYRMCCMIMCHSCPLVSMMARVCCKFVTSVSILPSLLLRNCHLLQVVVSSCKGALTTSSVLEELQRKFGQIPNLAAEAEIVKTDMGDQVE